jgi:hypothetical protein
MNTEPSATIDMLCFFDIKNPSIFCIEIQLSGTKKEALIDRRYDAGSN